ncbi:L-fucose isomerase-like protein [Halanaerobium saccharolyticum]|uniref:L-fucose isomerase-like protein n=1 Tax=Halanaerobium saccharolyticum TaxID=43595 RepID=A0A4R6S697_9FIRM|nr:fucose isomerase [Halanaerobium saccharolyticum]TDP95322.1 L-fucose isomerase-like protein [Halanaerobium saccharolyticum]
MKKEIKLGVVCLGRKTFDYQAAEEIFEDIKRDLKDIEKVDYTIIEDLVIEVDEAQAAAKKISSENVDALIVISGTFHLGHLVLELDKVVDKPILLWGLNELPYNGGKIRLNSVCGVNLNSSNLYKSGNRQYYVNIGDQVDKDWIDAIRIKSALENAKIGIVGYRAKGFFNLSFDELRAFEETGALIDHYELKELWEFKVENSEVDAKKEQLKGVFDVSDISSEQLDKVASLSAKLQNFVDSKGLSALAIRCWPEFADNFGISPCAAMSLLQSEDYILGCEGDIEGTMSMLAHQAVGAETPFLADLSQVDLEEDYALLWHCGVAPCNLWDGKCNISLDSYFAGGRGVTADFVMKSDKFSVLRIDSAQGDYRVFLQKGEGIPMEKDLKGTYFKGRFEKNINDILYTVTNTGVAHHISVVYGDYTEPFKIFADIKDWEVIE